MVEVVYERCCALDLHKKLIVASLITPGSGVKPVRETRQFGAMTADIEGMAAWLLAAGCTIVAMESTGVYWKPVVRHEALSDRERMKEPLLETVAAAS